MRPERTYLADLKEQSLAIITLTGNEGSSACLDGPKSRIFHRGGGHEWNRRVKSGGEGPAPKQRRVGIWGSLYKFLVVLGEPRHFILWVLYCFLSLTNSLDNVVNLPEVDCYVIIRDLVRATSRMVSFRKPPRYVLASILCSCGGLLFG